MGDNIHDLIIFESLKRLPCEIKNVLYQSIFLVATFFGFTYLIDDLKICIHICERSVFEKKRQGMCVNSADEVIAFTCDINSIFVIEYECIKEQFSPSSYTAVIVHECIHVLQFYFSRISPSQYVWLYESVACYLAGQKKKCNSKKIRTWEVFESEFYHMQDCYGVAYRFGEAIFRLYPEETLDIIKYPEKYKDRLIEIYNSEILR